MKSKFTWVGIVTALLVILTTFFVACKKDDVNEEVKYRGQVVHANTTTPYPNLPVKVTDGNNTHCQTLTDAGGAFNLTVRVGEINGEYYLLAGDENCTPKKVALGGFGQAEVNLGIIEVGEKKVDSETKYYIKHPWGYGQDTDWAWREMTSIGDGKYSVEGQWGGVGANINTSPDDDGTIWFAESAILGDGYARSLAEWLTFVYDSKNNTLYAGLNP